MPEARRPSEASAYHEAGHAVASHFLGRSFIKVSLDRAADGTLGWVGHGPPGEWVEPDVEVDGRTRRKVEQEIMILIAGSVCEETFAGEMEGRIGGPVSPNLQDFVALHGGDVDQAMTLAGYASASAGEAAAYLEWLWHRTFNLIRRPGFWPAVEALAAELVRVRTLDYRRARRVIEQARSA